MFDFYRIKLIARREVTTRFKMKAYRWTLVIQVVVALIAGLAPVAISYFTGDSIGGGDVLVVDDANSGFTERIQSNLIGDIPGLPDLQVTKSDSGAEAARTTVKDGDADAAVIVTDSGGAYHYELVTKDGSSSSITVQRVHAAIVTSNVEIAAERAGVPVDQASELVAAPPIVVESPVGESNDPAENFSGPLFAIVNIGLILTYIMFITYGTWIAQGVVEEKSSRMMEIMVNAATPRDLLVGKMIGVLIAGLCQILPMMLAGGLAFALQPRIADLLDVELTTSFLELDMASVSAKAVAIFLVYFIFGYFVFGSLFAATGSMVSRQEEVSQAIGPAMVLVVIGLMLAYVVMALPNSLLAKVLFLVPLTSPYVALSRVLMGDPGIGEIALSLGLLIVTAVLAMMLAAKVYRASVLMYGQKAGFMQIFKLRRMQQVAR